MSANASSGWEHLFYVYRPAAELKDQMRETEDLRNTYAWRINRPRRDLAELFLGSECAARPILHSIILWQVTFQRVCGVVVREQVRSQ